MDFDEFVARQRPALLRFATVLTGRPWLAEDLVSDVLGRAFERWPRIAGLAEPVAYVRRMIVNDYLSWHRRLRRSVPHGSVELPASEDTSEDHAERDAMIRRLDRLPRKQRAAVVLRYYLGLPDTEIAEHLDCAVPTVRSQISRALAALRIELSDEPAYATRGNR